MKALRQRQRMYSPTLLLALGQLFCWAGLYYVFPALLLEFEHRLEATRAQVTLAMTIALLTAALLSPVSGLLIDRGYGRWLLGGGAVVGALAMAGLTRASTLAQFYLSWGVVGAAMSAALYEPCFAFVVRHLSINANRAIGIITLVAGFASTIAFPLGAWLSQRFGLDAALLAFSLLVLVLGAPCLWLGACQLDRRFSGTRAGAQLPLRPARGLLRLPLFWLLTAAFSLAALVQGVTLNHLLPLLNERQLGAGQAIMLLTLMGPLQVFGRILWLLLSERVPPPLAMTACLGLMLLSFVLLFIAGSSFPLLFLYMVLQSASFGIFYILKPATTRYYLGEDGFGSINGLMAVPYLSCFALSPLLGSLIWSQLGYDGLTLCLATTALLSLMLLSAAARSARCAAEPGLR